jgi:CDP-2,3-bis-(O-geranylgeranyl)-sn-glycerol synthase
MQILEDIQLLLLIAAANTAPLVAKSVLGNRFSHPIDGGAVIRDGQPLLGSSKTIRGVTCSILATTILAPLVGLDVAIGFWIGTAAMAGDLLSSFLKRRLGLRPSSKATGLDQIPESLLPTIVAWPALSITIIDVIAIVAIFLVGEILISKALFRLQLRDRPY